MMMNIEAYKIIVYVMVAVLSLGIFGLMLRITQLPAYKPIRVRAVKNPAELIKRFKSNHIL
jgi:hypothetical protein